MECLDFACLNELVSIMMMMMMMITIIIITTTTIIIIIITALRDRQITTYALIKIPLEINLD